ncbi:MAG: biotin transporter BioY, partial [Candidatus Brocadiia bacterium]|nr:biotin transporter BioY [Candidatus Brocadiia bacterium]
RWRYELSVPLKLVFALGLACFTGLCAQIRIPHPFTDVPITGQVFAVLLSGVLLGRSYGATSQFFYVGLGAMGVPWFAGGDGGLRSILGRSGGYLIGFILAAALVGWFTDRRIRPRGIWGQALLMMVAVAIVYLFGAFQYAMVMRTGLWVTLMRTVVLFIPIDLAKALAVNALVWRSCPSPPTPKK